MKRGWTGAILAVGAFAAGCGDSRAGRPVGCAERYGFEPAPATAKVTAAVALANQLVSPEGRWSFVRHPVTRAGEVEVTVAPASIAAPDEFVWTADPGCVLLSSRWESRVAELFMAGAEISLSVEPDAALALALLHETGHLSPSAPVQYSDEPQLSEIEAATIQSRHPELLADAEAARLVRSAGKPGHPGFTAGLRLAMAATNIGWNLQARRQTSAFGSLLLRTPAVFGDRGYSHPNLELRFLVLSHRLAPTPTGRALLREFLEARSAAR